MHFMQLNILLHRPNGDIKSEQPIFSTGWYLFVFCKVVAALTSFSTLEFFYMQAPCFIAIG